MDVDDLYRRAGDDAVVLAVHLQPASGRTAVVGRHGTALKVKVAAPPEGGRANDACAAFLAETFGAPTAQVELVSGDKSRSKQFRVAGVDVDEFHRRLERLVSDSGAVGHNPRAPGRK
jgi:uncharacterized protein (TIGR00251 family)